MEVIEEIIKGVKNNGTLNVVIAGCTCSGKTTLANQIREMLNNYSVSIIHQDDYYKNLDKIPKSKDGYLTDSINAFELNEFRKDIRSFLLNGHVLVPRYDISSNKRLSKDSYVSKAQINIFEGLHTIRTLEYIDDSLKIFLDVSFETCLKRRIDRDTSFYNISEDRIREYFNSCVIPLSRDYILPQQNKADVIIDERGKIKCLYRK